MKEKDYKEISQTEIDSIVNIIKASKPQSVFDESFALSLRSKLISAKPFPKLTDSIPSTWFTASPFTSSFFKKTNKLSSGIIGATLAFIIAIPLTYIATKQTSDSSLPPVFVKDLTSGLNLKQQISDKGTNAFGKLALLSVPEATTSQTSGISTFAIQSEASTTSNVSTAITTDAENKSSLYSYVYTGSTIKISNTIGTVFKRKKGADAGQQLAGFLQNSNFGLKNLSTFSNLNLLDMQLAESNPDGYTVGLNFDQNIITISSNEAHILETTPAAKTLDSGLLIAKANNFLSSHVVDLSSYGKPFIIANDIATNTKTILYPLMLGAEEVYNTDGTQYGMTVSVTSDTGAVVSVNNLASQLYESSNYSIEQNSQKIISKLPTASSSDAVTVNVSTPQQVLMRYMVQEQDGSQDELYVPAVLFKPSDTTSKAPSVIIPLLKDTLGVASGTSTSNEAAADAAISSTTSPL